MDPADAARILDEELARGMERFAAASDTDQLEREKVAVLGRKAPLPQVQRSLGSLPVESRRELGRRINDVFASLREAVESRRVELEEGAGSSLLEADAVDITLPGRRPRPGSRHPLSLVEEQMITVFTRMGYRVAEGPEIELDLTW